MLHLKRHTDSKLSKLHRRIEMSKFLKAVVLCIMMLVLPQAAMATDNAPNDPIIGTWEMVGTQGGYITFTGQVHLWLWNHKRLGRLDIKNGNIYDVNGNPAGTVLDYRPTIKLWVRSPESGELLQGQIVVRITDAVAQKFAGEYLPQLVRLVEAVFNYIRAIGATPMEDAKVMDSYNALLEVSGGRMSSSVAGVEMFVVGTPPGKLYIFLTQYETNLQGAEIMFVNDGVQPPSGGDGDSPTGDPPGGDPPLG